MTKKFVIDNIKQSCYISVRRICAKQVGKELENMMHYEVVTD